MRLGHACICPRMVPSHPVFRLYPPLPKVGVSAAKNCKIPEKRAQFEKAKTAFVCVWGGYFIWSRRSRLSRAASDLTRLFNHARSIVIEAQKSRWRFWEISNSFLKKPLWGGGRHPGTIFTPKQAHSRLFVTEGSFFARQKVTKLMFMSRQACIQKKNNIHVDYDKYICIRITH